MLIPRMLFVCIMNQRNTNFQKIRKSTITLKRYVSSRTPEQRKAINKNISEKKKLWWANTSKKKLDKMCKQRGKSLKKHLAGLTAEERHNKTIPAKKAYATMWKDSEKGPKLKKMCQKLMKNINDPNKRIEIPRVKDYSGVVTMKELETV